jgi:hypothetical protein
MDIEFIGCIALRLDMNLEGKRVYGDAILDATCHASSPWLMQFAMNELAGTLRFPPLLHFRIQMVPPGGLVEVLAADFQAARCSE